MMEGEWVGVGERVGRICVQYHHHHQRQTQAPIMIMHRLEMLESDLYLPFLFIVPVVVCLGYLYEVCMVDDDDDRVGLDSGWSSPPSAVGFACKPLWVVRIGIYM